MPTSAQDPKAATELGEAQALILRLTRRMDDLSVITSRDTQQFVKAIRELQGSMRMMSERVERLERRVAGVGGMGSVGGGGGGSEVAGWTGGSIPRGGGGYYGRAPG